MPQVRGKVITLDAESNIPLKAGDKLFTIDPTPYQAKVDDIKSQLVLAERRLAESEKLWPSTPPAACTMLKNTAARLEA